MSTQVTPFENTQVPAFLKAKGKVSNMFGALARVGYKVLSIKSKVFTIVDGDTRTLVTKADDPDSPAANLEVVIIAANPNKSRVYYKGGYDEGAAMKPDCYSNDNTAPAADAANPQSKKCAVCPHAQYGSKITESGKKSFACSESCRIAVAPAGQLNDVMMLRVPATSLKPLVAYGADLALKGVEPQNVVTRIGFDYTVSHPALTFKALRFVTEDMNVEIETLRESEQTQYITGTKALPAREELESPEGEATAPEAEKPVAPKPEKPKAAKPAPVASDDDLPKAPRVEVKVEASVAAEAAVASSVDDLDFDD